MPAPDHPLHRFTVPGDQFQNTVLPHIVHLAAWNRLNSELRDVVLRTATRITARISRSGTRVDLKRLLGRRSRHSIPPVYHFSEACPLSTVALLVDPGLLAAR